MKQEQSERITASNNAPMVELVDTLVLGTSALCVGVRVSLGAPNINTVNHPPS